ncbi:MAG: hypothetical protein QOJ63_960 [Solirubrobacteraceae bacterium]|jgi:hypothetical protein|nr:hypothetical protein [Solirubrobacteraceae bacterium]
MTTPEIIRTHPLIEEILDAPRDHAQGDDRGYLSRPTKAATHG